MFSLVFLSHTHKGRNRCLPSCLSVLFLFAKASEYCKQLFLVVGIALKPEQDARKIESCASDFLCHSVRTRKTYLGRSLFSLRPKVGVRRRRKELLISEFASEQAIALGMSCSHTHTQQLFSKSTSSWYQNVKYYDNRTLQLQAKIYFYTSLVLAA